jgi:hypothetical protein
MRTRPIGRQLGAPVASSAAEVNPAPSHVLLGDAAPLRGPSASEPIHRAPVRVWIMDDRGMRQAPAPFRAKRQR